MHESQEKYAYKREMTINNRESRSESNYELILSYLHLDSKRSGSAGSMTPQKQHELQQKQPYCPHKQDQITSDVIRRSR